jgi:hypothetical protein
MTEFGLRKIAYPLDWMFTNNFEGLCRLLSNDFVNFLQPEILEVHPYLPFVVVNTLYGIEFRHDFPSTGPTHMKSILNSDWRDHISEIAEKYNRRIERFNELANHKGKVFFMRMAYNSFFSYEWPKVVTREEAIILRDVLRKKFPRTDFELIIVNYRDEIASDEAGAWKIDGVRNYNIKSDYSDFKKVFKKLGVLER